MTDFLKAWQAFWGQFRDGGKPIPAYVRELAPEDAAFPYIIYEAPRGGYWGVTTLTAFVWCEGKGKSLPTAQVARILDAIADAIPHSGAKITWNGGGAAIYRNPSGFVSLYQTPDEGERPVLGGRISVEVHFYC